MLFSNVSFAHVKDIKQRFMTCRHKIIISSHTTPFCDGINLHNALLKLGVDNHMFYTKCTSWLFPLFPFLRKWCIDIMQGGFVEGQVTALASEADGFCRVIFPSGGRFKWKTGFYYLAKGLRAKGIPVEIFIIGIDYKQQSIVIDSVLDIDKPDTETISDAQMRLRRYSPSCLYYLLNAIGYGCDAHPPMTFASTQ